jgi:large subunit ribosomal protein L10
MPLTRSEKDKLIAEYQGGLAVAPHAFLLGFKGISVPQVTELRNRVRATGGEYLVVKNTLALRAIDSTALAALQEHFVGPTAVVFTDHDPVALAKALTDYAKEVPALEFKAGMVERRAVAAGQIKEIAQLPSREQLIAKLLYLLQSPITRFARLLAALPRSLVVVLDQVSKKKEESGGAVAATEAPAAAEAPQAAAEPQAAPAAAEAPQAAVEPQAAGAEAPAAAEAPQAAAEPQAAGETEAKGTTEGAAGG